MLHTSWKRNDKKAHILIWIFSAIVFIAISGLERFTLNVDLGFNPHVFAMLSAIVNTFVSIFLVIGLLFIKQKKFEAHKRIMLFTMLLSIFFLVFYLLHHLFVGPTYFGDINHDGTVDASEVLLAGPMRTFYLILMSTHIILAGVVMPLVLYTAYRALSGQWILHKKLARITFPIWLYVSVTGVLVYLLIQKYYV